MPDCDGVICGCKTEILSENEECTVTKIVGENGHYINTSYRIFPGIEFIYGDAHIQEVVFENGRQASGNNILEIVHCREGRMEYSVNGEFWYMTPGDLSIARISSVSSSAYFPLRHYHGLTVRIDLERSPRCFSCLLDDVNVQPKAIAEKFCSGTGNYIARANPSFAHIFSELYAVPEKIRKGYFKIKVMELLLFLSGLELKEEPADRVYTKQQVSLAKKISLYLGEHMENHITIEQLADRFCVSEACVKNAFKGVYGIPVGSYIRARKMESAAFMLEYTDKTILEIAGEHGYDNGSKFANAFRQIKGMNPAEYRNMLAGKTS